MPSQAETIAALQGLNPAQLPFDPNAAITAYGSAVGLPDAIRALGAVPKAGKQIPQQNVTADVAGFPQKAAGVLGDVTGVNDAMRALRGEMTEDEAKNFALTSAIGLLPGAAPEKVAVKTMGELLPHLYPEASSFAKMTPKEYLGMFGSDLPKQLPQDVENVLKPYMQPAPKVGKVPGPGPVQQFAPKEITKATMGSYALKQMGGADEGMYAVHGPSGKIAELTATGVPNQWHLSMDNLPFSKNVQDPLQGLNAAATLFDVANTHVGGPSMPLNKAYQSIKPDVDLDVPREGGVPYTPLAAKILGRSENLVHGTKVGPAAWGTPLGARSPSGASLAMGTTLDALRLPDDELGVHFGNPKQAQVFSGDRLEPGYAPRTYPVVVQTNNPLRLPDLGSWGPHNVSGALKKYHPGVFSDEELRSVTGDRMDDEEQTRGLRNLIQSKGYDSVVYKNTEEDPGFDSFIKFTPSPQAPNFVTGVRSPWAAFDPSKIMRPELAAGLAGGTLAAPAIDPNLLKALTGSPTDQQQ